MLEQSGIDRTSRVLDIGCGNGNTAVWLAQETGCSVVGIDLSGVRVGNARERAARHPGLEVSFQKASATRLPFADAAFTHIWSQATLYHVHDRSAALAEIARVLVDGGVLIFDDLVSPTAAIDDHAQRYVYDRLLFEPTFSHDAYADALTAHGLMVLDMSDLSGHLRQSYACLADLARPQYPELSAAYDEMCVCIDARQVGWGLFRCERVIDRVAWIYDTPDKPALEARYDAWSRCYDADLDVHYRNCPQAAAGALADVLSQRDQRILDAGAGTGMVGEALAEAGYTEVVGVDLSAGMLAMAEAKSVYRELQQADLETVSELFPPASFAAILSVGVFTHGHAPPHILRDLVAVLEPGGWLVLTLRLDYYASSATLRSLLSTLPLAETTKRRFTIFGDEEMYVITWQKNLQTKEIVDS